MKQQFDKILNLKVSTVLLILISSGFFYSCKTQKISVEKPVIEAFTEPYKQKLSTIVVPISFPIVELQNMLNRDYKGVIYNDESFVNDNIKIKVTKTGNLKVTADAGKINFVVPLHIWVRGRAEWTACSFCPTLSGETETEFDLTIKTTSSVTISKDWKLKTTTTGDFEWGKEKPSLSIGPVDIPIATFVEGPMRDQFKELSGMLDKEIQSMVNLKQMVNEAWIALQEPIQTDTSYDAWMVVTPKEVVATSLSISKNVVNFKAGMKCYLDIVTQKKPQVKVNKTLPEISFQNNLPDGFEMGLKANITYAFASKMLMDNVSDTTFSFQNGKYKIKINNLNLTGSGNKMLMEMNFNGSAKALFFRKKLEGTVFLEGTPFYDSQTNAIKMKDFDFSVKSKNILLKSASWMAKVGFQQKISGLMEYPLSEDLNYYKKILQDELNNQLTPYVIIKGTLDELSPSTLYLTNEGIVAIISAKGKINVQVNKL